jgi:hypothetical protein
MGARCQQQMPCRPQFSKEDDQFVENTSSHWIKLITSLIYWFIFDSYKTPCQSLSQPLRMAAHVSKQGNPYIPRRRRSKRLHHGGDVWGIVVLGSKGISLLFLL